MKQNRLDRGHYENGTKRPHNNRKGGISRHEMIEHQAFAHFYRIKRLKQRGGTPVSRNQKEVDKEQDIRNGKKQIW